jgi:hypothetical protein
LYGRAFVIFESSREAFDARQQFHNGPFLQLTASQEGEGCEFTWNALKDEDPLQFLVAGQQEANFDTVAGMPEIEITVTGCQNLPKADVVGSCDAYVQIKQLDGVWSSIRNRLEYVYRDGYVFQTDPVPNTLDPKFKENNVFKFHIDDVESPGKLEIIVMDADKYTKDDVIGMFDISSDALIAMMEQRGPDQSWFALEKPRGKKVVGMNGEPSIVQIRWVYRDFHIKG